jgi:carboxymethylenebutenolidase
MKTAIAVSLVSAAVVALTIPRQVPAPTPAVPVVVTVRSGDATLGAQLWRPAGEGPFPAVLVNHGSGRTREQLERLGPYERQAETLGPVFARHGYVLLFLFREGVGPSAAAGRSAIDLMNDEAAARGQDARNVLQMSLLEGREMTDARAGLAYLRELPYVDRRRLAVVGVSFGGSLTVLMTELEASLRAAVLFSSAGYSWDRSPELRERLLAAVRRTRVPLFFIHAENDYSTNPGKVLAAEMERLGRPHRLKIYPPVGTTPDEGHDFPYNSVAAWEPDVFAFLDEFVRK